MLAADRAVPDDERASERLRLTFLGLMIAVLLLVLVGRLWYLQVMVGPRYVELAQGNAVRTISLVAPRGEIRDVEGRLLVGNELVNVVSVMPSEIEEDRRAGVMRDLADLLGTTAEELERRIATATVSAVRPKPVAVDVPDDVVLYLWEHQSTSYPGVYAEQLPRRAYPQGQLAAHVLGHTGEISTAELEQPEYATHRPGQQIGWAGVERSYESELRGVEGLRHLEVDARNEVVRQLDETLPQPGADLALTIDLDAQQAAEEALRAGIDLARATTDTSEDRPSGTYRAPAGAVVVLRPATGEVVAMASSPTYSPSEFVGGVSSAYYRDLLDPASHRPLLNRAIQSAYPPGSVFKPVTAGAALDNGYMTTSSTLPCPPSWEWNGARYRNWATSSMGRMDIARSLTMSCDTVYYELARQMYTDEVARGDDTEIVGREALAWGLGARTGIDLPSESDGVVPGRAWRRAYWERTREDTCAQAESAEDGEFKDLLVELCSEQGARWRGGDAVNMSIGQGDVATTPLQIAVMYAAIANGGTLYRPHVVSRIARSDGTLERVEPLVTGTLPTSSAALAEIRRGLEGVTAPGGTAGSVFGDFPVPTAGKTGTAEAKPRQPYSWYAGYAPVDEPAYVVVAVVEEAGGGSRVSAPIARRVLEHLLDVDATPLRAGGVTE